MPSSFGNEWTIIDPATNVMASTDNTIAALPAEPSIKVTVNTKPTTMPTEEGEEVTESAPAPVTPKLARQPSIESNISNELDYSARRTRRRSFIPASPSPSRSRHRTVMLPPSTHIISSTHLLSQVSVYDGMAELPHPPRSSIYITTYPFGSKDVSKWSWLFARAVEDVYLSRGRGLDSDAESGDDEYEPRRRPRRNRSPYWDGTTNIPSVYLSRALDTEVLPEDAPDVRYLVVTQNRHQPAGSKLQIVESRKAAGIVMFYEALRGDSTVFVGATLGWRGERVRAKKFVRVEGVQEAVEARAEGNVGVIC
jgi:hypothetical protein